VTPSSRARRIALTLNLKDDASLQEAYRRHHGAVPRAIEASLREAGILDMQIYALGTRLFMLMEVAEDFSFERKAELDAANPGVQEWERLMWTFQDPLPEASPGEKWMVMEEIYSLGPH
jgi:L-rhamnose mutarotase